MLPLLALVSDISRREFVITSEQLLVGGVSALVAIICVLFHYEVMKLTAQFLPRVAIPRRARIVALILVMMAAHVVEVWIFALTFWQMDQYPALGHLSGVFDEGAFDFVYYSVTTFTTLGFGDIVPSGPMRILTGSEALVGLSLITWTASFAFLEMQSDWREYRKPRHPAE